MDVLVELIAGAAEKPIPILDAHRGAAQVVILHRREADDLVYFGRSRDRNKKVRITLGMWNGAATGEGAYRLLVPGTKDVGGYYVSHIS